MLLRRAVAVLALFLHSSGRSITEPPLENAGQLTASRKRHSLSDIPCPTVFVYFDAPTVDGGVRPDAVTKARTFGTRFAYAGMRDSSPYNLAELMLYRLQHSRHCRITSDPASADLFLIPVLTKPKIATTWAKRCETPDLWGTSLVYSGNASSADSANRYSLSFLPHLTPETASRHLFFISKGHYVTSRGDSCAWIRGEPPAAPYFAAVQRFAYSHTYAGAKYSRRAWAQDGAPKADGRVVSVPYPAWLHWSAGDFGQRKQLPPWQRFDSRPLRIHYVAGLHGAQAALRQRLLDECELLGRRRCRALARFPRFTAEHMLEKQSAVFCLEPEGDSPFRKGVYDSIVSGCIPVLFSQDSDAVSFWHWGAFRNASRVLMSADDVMAAPRGKALQQLLDMPRSRIRAMQASISKNAHRLQYSLDDMPSGDDAFEVILKKAHLRAKGVPLEELFQDW